GRSPGRSRVKRASTTSICCVTTACTWRWPTSNRTPCWTSRRSHAASRSRTTTPTRATELSRRSAPRVEQVPAAVVEHLHHDPAGAQGRDRAGLLLEAAPQGVHVRHHDDVARAQRAEEPDQALLPALQR